MCKNQADFKYPLFMGAQPPWWRPLRRWRWRREQGPFGTFRLLGVSASKLVLKRDVKLDFKTWLRRQSAGFQDDVLGPR